MTPVMEEPVAEMARSIPLVELESICTLVLEGLRATRGGDVMISGDAVAGWRELQRTLRPGRVDIRETEWLATLLRSISLNLAAAAESDAEEATAG